MLIKKSVKLTLEVIAKKLKKPCFFSKYYTSKFKIPKTHRFQIKIEFFLKYKSSFILNILVKSKITNYY